MSGVDISDISAGEKAEQRHFRSILKILHSSPMVVLIKRKFAAPHEEYGALIPSIILKPVDSAIALMHLVAR